MQSQTGTVGAGGTVTFLFTDIEGSTQLLQQVGAAYPIVLEQHTSLLQEIFERHGGRVVDRAGDGLFVVFNRARSALAATVEAQRALLLHPWPDGARVRVRMGVHTGEPVVSGTGYVGLDVHRAARVSAAAHGGQVLLSEATRQLVAGELPAGVGLRDLGEHRLKDLPREERLHQVVAPDLPSAFPPLRTADVLPGNLPARPARLIGRESELQAIQDLVRRDDVRLLTLTGAGGTGKTSLAVELAARLFDHFRDGVAYVPLAAIAEPELVFTAIAQALAVAPVAAQPVRDAVIEHLCGRQLLLVLDNFEHVLGAAADLAVLSHRAPRITMLVTSRFALNLTIEHEFAVAPLRTPDPRVSASASVLRVYPAVELFVQRATAVKPGFGLDEDSTVAVAAICHRLDGLPLAIELAAARIKIFSPRALLARLDRRLELLSGGARDMPARHRTLRHAIGWSYDLLAPDEQALLRRLAVFAGGCSLEEAEIVCAAAGEPVVSALEGVSALVDKSLLRQDPGDDGEPRFVMLETVRDFALERLEASAEDEVTRAAHADVFITLSESAAAELAGAGQPLWLDRLDRDHDNLRGAFDWAIRAGDAARALRLGAALVRFWIIRAFHTEGRQRLRSALALPHAAAEQPLRARVLTGAAILAYEQIDFEEANALLHEALEYYRTTGDQRCIGETLNHLGWVAFFAGDIDRAATLSQEALAAHERLANTRGIALSLTNLGGIALLRGDFRRALELYTRALELRGKLNEARSIAYGSLNLSWTLNLLGQHERASALAGDALRTLRTLGDTQLIAFSCWMMGEAALDRGDVAEAVRLLDEAAAIGREIRQWSMVGLTLGFTAEALALQGETQRALEMAREAVSLHERDSIFLWRMLSLTAQANVLRIAGLNTLARESYLRTLEQAQPRQMRFTVSRCAAGLAALASAAGQHEEALRLAGAARTLRATTGAAMVPGREPDLERIIAAARDALGANAAAHAYEAGAANDDVRQLLTEPPAQP